MIKVSKRASETFEKIKKISVWGDKVTWHLLAAHEFWLPFGEALIQIQHFGLCRKQKSKIDETEKLGNMKLS